MNNSSQQHFDLQNTQRAFAYLSLISNFAACQSCLNMGSNALITLGESSQRFFSPTRTTSPIFKTFCIVNSVEENLEECSAVAQHW